VILFRFIHASDLHFAVVPNKLSYLDGGLSQFHNNGWNFICPSSHDEDLAEAFARFYHESYVADEIDFAIITGDVATTGHQEDLEKAHSFIDGAWEDRWFSRGGASLSASTHLNSFALLPGNHDRYGDRGKPGNALFDKVFSDYWNDGKRVTSRIISKAGVSMAVVMADFTLVRKRDASWKPFSYLGQGKVYDDKLDNRLEELKRYTSELRKRFSIDFIVWATHFPPQYPRIPNKLRLLNEEKLVALAEEMDVNLILAGHMHKHKAYPISEKCVVLCSGTATGFNKTYDNAFAVVEVTVSGGAKRKIDVVSTPIVYQESGYSPQARAAESFQF